MTDKAKARTIGVITLLVIYAALRTAPHPKEATFRIQFEEHIPHKDSIPMPLDFLESLGTTIFGSGLGLLTQKYSQEQDFQNQMRLMTEQQRMGQENARFNQGLALETWEKTNFSAQREQLEKAGLNAGLMYAKGGAGGATMPQGGNQPTISAPPKMDAGLALQLGLQTAMTKAQIENIEADTAVKQKQAPQVEAQTHLIEANTNNAKLDAGLKELDLINNRIRNDVAEAQKPDAIKELTARAEKWTQDAITAGLENQVMKQVVNEKIEQVRLATTETALRIELQRAGLIKIGAETKEINANIAKIAEETVNLTTKRQQDWINLDMHVQEVQIKQFLADLEKQQIMFNTSTPEQVKQWLNALMGGAQVAGSIGRPAGAGARPQVAR